MAVLLRCTMHHDDLSGRWYLIKVIVMVSYNLVWRWSVVVVVPNGYRWRSHISCPPTTNGPSAVSEFPSIVIRLHLITTTMVDWGRRSRRSWSRTRLPGWRWPISPYYTIRFVLFKNSVINNNNKRERIYLYLVGWWYAGVDSGNPDIHDAPDGIHSTLASSLCCYYN